MYEDLNYIHYSPIRDFDYAQWFQYTRYNGKTLNDQERDEFIQMVNEEITRYSSELPLLFKRIKEINGIDDKSHNIETVLYSSSLFVTMTTVDCMVASKYFLLADTDYDKRYMRGKLKIVLNEGFKKLYGFKEKKEGTVWHTLSDCMQICPDVIKQQYLILSSLLENHSHSSPWWKFERDIETHLETEKLYESRMVDIDESQVMMETLRLFGALYAVDSFLSNVLNTFVNTLLFKYQQGELIGE